MGGWTMGQADQDRRIDYVEFAASDIEKTKSFYSGVFGWAFTDHGPEYTSFHDGRLGGGFTKDPDTSGPGPLVVLYAADLEAMKDKVKSHGGKITKEIFEFPGGHRFQFSDPTGTELAVWSDQ